VSYSFNSFKILEGNGLILRPFLEQDLGSLSKALVSDTTWFSITRDMRTPEKFISYFQSLLDRGKKGEALTLVAQHKENGGLLGMSTYQYPSLGFRKIEIGFTWIAESWQRTFVNTEMKFLMLSHAFEEMKTSRVEFSIHPDNEKSNAAIKRIGAVYEGTLRKWRFLPGVDDGNRNIYSIIDSEWPGVKKRFVEFLTR
jgi:RimJ/RimL family protein N-acetyltransferase